MSTHAVPPARWQEFLCSLGNHRLNQPVSIQVSGGELGSQALAEHLPLVGLSLEQKGSESGAIEVTLAGGSGPFTHLVLEPQSVWAQEDAAGRVHALDIEDKAKVKTLIFFEEPAREPSLESPPTSEVD